jgi:FAD dependent oxidoreductase TIGR03364
VLSSPTNSIIAVVADFDLIVVGAGIVGLAHALAAARRGLSVVVVERDARASQASVRNFGFVTVSGQAEGETRRRALRSREVWDEVAPAAGIEILQRGTVVVARREEAFEVLRQFAAGPMGAGCMLWNEAEIRRQVPRLRAGVRGGLASAHELRVEARDALPRLALWLAQHHGVAFRWSVAALEVESGVLRHAGGRIAARAIVVAPGNAIADFAPELARRVNAHSCKLQMMRIATSLPALRLPATVMSDLSIARYAGFAAQPGAGALRARLERECAPQLANGVHLIVAQSADGTLVVGDSHHYGEAGDAPARPGVEAMILAELEALFDFPAPRVVERWLGYYPVADVKPVVSESLAPGVQLVGVTNGLGMSTAFALGEETVASLFG